MTNTRTAQGPATINSYARPECHAPSGFSVCDYSGANGSRERQTRMILDYWQYAGVLRTRCPRNNTCPEFAARRACNLSGLHVRELTNPELADMWFPLAGQADTGRKDRAELSHIVSSDNGGAYCACNLLPEVGETNKSRGRADMVLADLPESARDLLAGWGAYWMHNVARQASKRRLARTPVAVS